MSIHSGEQQRHQWLNAIGIDSWLPRAPLPGAAPSADWVAAFHYAESGRAGAQESGSQEPPVVAAAQPSVPKPSRPAAARIDTAALLDAPKRASAPAAEAAAVRQPLRASAPAATPARPAQQEEAPRFKLAYLVRGDLLIIDSLPPHQPEGFSRQHKRLLQGITSALGLTAEQELSAPFMLPWPMLASKTLDQGPAEARRAVQHKLQRTLAFTPAIKHILLMGETAARWVVEPPAGADYVQGQRLTLGDGRQMLMTLSLSELLRLPERKAEVWRDIQPLRRTPDA